MILAAVFCDDQKNSRRVVVGLYMEMFCEDPAALACWKMGDYYNVLRGTWSSVNARQ